MKTYLNSISANQAYCARPFFEQEIHPPQFSGLEDCLDDVERLCLGERPIVLLIDQKRVPFDRIVQNATHSPGAQILQYLARELPVAFPACSDPTLVNHVRYETAALLTNAQFHQAVASAMQDTLAADLREGALRIGDPSWQATNVTLSPDGQSLDCNITAYWHQFTERNEVHAMQGGSPVLTVHAKIRLPLLAMSNRNYRLPQLHIYHHVNTPCRQILEQLSKSKKSFCESLLNKLADIPLLGRLIRRARLELVSSKSFDQTALDAMPAHEGGPPTTGAEPTVWHGEDYAVSGRHIVTRNLRAKSVRTLTLQAGENGVTRGWETQNQRRDTLYSSIVAAEYEYQRQQRLNAQSDSSEIDEDEFEPPEEPLNHGSPHSDIDTSST